VALAASLPVFFLLSGQRLRSLFALALVAAALVIAFPGLNGVYLALLEGGSVAAAIEQVLPGEASVSARPMPLATAATLERSTEPPSPCGVSTAMKSTFACCTNPEVLMLVSFGKALVVAWCVWIRVDVLDRLFIPPRPKASRGCRLRRGTMIRLLATFPSVFG
jgi:hypothetical protein